MEKLISAVKEKIKAFSLDIIIPVYLLNLVLEVFYFFPNLGEINIWDEATYIQNGYRLLTEGVWPNLAGSPLSSIMFALSLWPVSGSRDFFVLGDAFARFFMFTLIFFSAYLVARELHSYTNPWIMVGLIFIVPVASTMFLFPSDALFAGFSALAFWQMLVFLRTREGRHLGWASGLMGIGTLARAEGLILFGVILLAALIFKFPGKRWFEKALLVLVPFVVIVAGYVLIYGLAAGDFRTGLSERTFNNFESGHEVIYSQTGTFSPTVSARLESGEAFGTAEENNYSVFRAISRNPGVYFKRLGNVLPVFAQFAVKAYGNKFILIFLWLGFRGLIALIENKHIPLAVLCIGWFLPLGVGFINTFFREGYFMMPFFVMFSLASVGLGTILKKLGERTEKFAFVYASGLVLGISLLARNPSMFYRSALFIFGLVLLLLWKKRPAFSKNWISNALWVVLAIGLIMRGGYPSPELPAYGDSDLEQSVYFLQSELPKGSHVLAGAPAYIWAARMTYYGMNSYDIPEFIDADSFLTWMRAQSMDAVYVDRHFPPLYAALVEELAGEGLQEAYATPERDIVIFLVTEEGVR